MANGTLMFKPELATKVALGEKTETRRKFGPDDFARGIAGSRGVARVFKPHKGGKLHAGARLDEPHVWGVPDYDIPYRAQWWIGQALTVVPGRGKPGWFHRGEKRWIGRGEYDAIRKAHDDIFGASLRLEGFQRVIVRINWLDVQNVVDIDHDGAVREGFGSRWEFLDYYRDLNGKYSLDLKCFVINFTRSGI